MKPSGIVATKEKDAALHGEVTEWHGENRFWLDEVDIWRKEHGQALRDLAVFEQKFLHPLREKIDRHGEELAVHDQRLKAHEHALGQHIQGNDVVPYDCLIEAHQRAAEQHSQQREQHANAKEQFAASMAHTAIVRQALAEQS